MNSFQTFFQKDEFNLIEKIQNLDANSMNSSKPEQGKNLKNQFSTVLKKIP